MKYPNFFIIGAPKCGTTALYSYLKEHPQIYLSELKEPHFFNDTDEGRNFTEQDDYLKLFEPAGEQHRAVGEASVFYLYSKSAVKKIHQFNPAAKLIVMLRHPVDMFFSLHQQNLFRFRENVRDPEQAWSLQPERADGRHIPRGCREPRSVQYQAVCSLGAQLERLFGNFPKEQVLVISSDEFQRNTRAVYERVLAFLGVDSDGRKDFPRENSSKMHRSFRLARCLAFTSFSKTPLFGRCVATAKSKRSVAFWVAFRNLLERSRELNTRPFKPQPDEVFVNRLNAVFEQDIEKIKQLAGITVVSKYKKNGDAN
jgi:hypothetical protein